HACIPTGSPVITRCESHGSPVRQGHATAVNYAYAVRAPFLTTADTPSDEVQVGRTDGHLAPGSCVLEPRPLCFGPTYGVMRMIVLSSTSGIRNQETVIQTNREDAQPAAGAGERQRSEGTIQRDPPDGVAGREPAIALGPDEEGARQGAGRGNYSMTPVGGDPSDAVGDVAP